MTTSTKAVGPFRIDYGRTRWNEKTICFGGGKGYDSARQEWRWFIGLCFWAVYVNIGIVKGWWKR